MHTIRSPYSSAAASAEDQAYLHLQQQIRLGTLAVGARLIPDIIAGQIGVSRMPVRGALRRLADEGLIEIRANRGAIVRGLNRREMRDVFEMRSVLEGLAMRNAVPNMRAEHLRRLTAMLDDFDLSAGESVDWTSSHRAFHEYLCSFCDQPRLLREIAELHSIVEPYMRMWASQPGREHRMHAAHQELIDVLRAGDPQRCEQAMRQHVMNTVDTLTPYLPDAG